MDLYDCSGSLVRPSTRLMLAVILFIDYPRGPFVVCGVVSCPIALTGRACVFTWGNQKISWRVGGPNQQGGSRIVWAVLGICTSTVAVHVHLLPILLLCVCLFVLLPVIMIIIITFFSVLELSLKVVDIVVMALIPP